MHHLQTAMLRATSVPSGRSRLHTRRSVPNGGRVLHRSHVAARVLVLIPEADCKNR